MAGSRYSFQMSEIYSVVFIEVPSFYRVVVKQKILWQGVNTQGTPTFAIASSPTSQGSRLKQYRSYDVRGCTADKAQHALDNLRQSVIAASILGTMPCTCAIIYEKALNVITKFKLPL